jgi:hypothetical protein
VIITLLRSYLFGFVFLKVWFILSLLERRRFLDADVDFPLNSLNIPDVCVEVTQPFQDDLGREVKVQRPCPVDEDILCLQQLQRVQSVVWTKDTEALVQQTIRLKKWTILVAMNILSHLK